MSRIFKTFQSLFIMTIFVIIAIGIISADINVSSARKYHSVIIKEIEESNLSQSIIDSCKDNASELGYKLITTNIVNESNQVIAVDVVLEYNYSIQFLNVISNHEIRGIAR